MNKKLRIFNVVLSVILFFNIANGCSSDNADTKPEEKPVEQPKEKKPEKKYPANTRLVQAVTESSTYVDTLQFGIYQELDSVNRIHMFITYVYDDLQIPMDTARITGANGVLTYPLTSSEQILLKYLDYAYEN